LAIASIPVWVERETLTRAPLLSPSPAIAVQPYGTFDRQSTVGTAQARA
jgi:hypothetical protein